MPARSIISIFSYSVTISCSVVLIVAPISAKAQLITDLIRDLGTLTTTVTNQGNDIATLNVDLSLLNSQTNLSLNTINAQVGVNAADIVQLGYDLNALTPQIAGNVAATVGLGVRVDGLDTALSGVTGIVTANTSAIVGNTTSIAANTAAIAAAAVRASGQDAALAAVTGTVAASTAAISANSSNIAANAAAIGSGTVRDDGQDITIDAATRLATNAQASSTSLRDDVAAGRVGLVQQDANGRIAVGGQTGGTEVAMAGTAGPRRITGVADGTAGSDAATVGQVARSQSATLDAANAYTDSRFANLTAYSAQREITANNVILRKEMNAAAASSAAISGLPHSIIPGEGMGSLSIGGRGSEVAFAMGVSKAFRIDHTPIVRAGAAMDANSGTLTYNAAVGFHF